MFRETGATPWVPYNPQDQPETGPGTSFAMDDAPLISTLREEDSPPPQPAKASAVRSVKLLVSNPATSKPKPPANDNAQPAPSSSTSKKRNLSQMQMGRGPGGDDGEEDELEEDQLIDDDDKPIPPNKIDNGKKKATPKKRQKKEPAAKEKKLPKVTLQLGPQDVPPPQSGPTETPPKPVRRRGPNKKEKTPSAKAQKAATAAKLKLLPPHISSHISEDVASIASEGYTGTAASSPVNTHYDPTTSPGTESIALPTHFPLPPSSINGDAASDYGGPSHLMAGPPAPSQLDGVPIPVYPLPTKPFPVMPPPKMSSGFASTLTIDRSGKKVRHWRPAKREIRGIAGGRWFCRVWVGSKESDYAGSLNAKLGKASAVEAGATSAGTPATNSNSTPDPNGSKVLLGKLGHGTPLSVPALLKAKAEASNATNTTASESASFAPSRATSAAPTNTGEDIGGAIEDMRDEPLEIEAETRDSLVANM